MTESLLRNLPAPVDADGIAQVYHSPRQQVVPVSYLSALVDDIKPWSAQHDELAVNFGHARNENLHRNLRARADAKRNRVPALRADVLLLMTLLKGTLLDGHEPSMVKRRFMPLAIEAATVPLMHNAKASFDSDGALNPGKLLP